MSLGDWMRWLAGTDEPAAPRVQANSISTSEELSRIIRALEGGVSAAGVRVNSNSAEGVTAVYRCVRLLSDTLSWLPLAAYRLDRAGRKVPLDSDVIRLLTVKPNDRQSAAQFRRLMQRDLELRGNAYAVITRGVGDRPIELLRLHPDRVRVVELDGEVVYRVTGTGEMVSTEYAQRDMLHLWEWSDDGLVGKSTIQAHRDTIGEGLAMREHGSKMFANGARPSGILEVTDTAARMGPEDVEALRDDVDSIYAGASNAFATVVLPGGISYKPVSLNMKDAQFIEGRRLNIEDIARIFGVPPHKIGALDRATFNNIEHLGIEFVTDSIRPRSTTWEQAIHAALFDAAPDILVEFDLSYLLMGDAKSRAEAHQILRRNGVINANEWREEEGWNRREDSGGDQYIIEGNMAINDGRDPSATGMAGD